MVGLKRYLRYGAVILMMYSPSASALDRNDGDACTQSGVWHQQNNANGVMHLVCNGTTWEQILYLDKNDKIGATQYCDANGNNCFTADGVGGIETTIGAATPVFTNNLDDVLDVNTAGVANEECLQYDSSTSTWITGTCGSGGGTIESIIGAATPVFANDLDDVLDVDTTGVANEECLQYNSSTSTWITAACGSSGGTIESIIGAATPVFANDLDDVLDVNTTGVTNEECLQYNSSTSTWITGACVGSAVIENVTGATTPLGLALWESGGGDRIYYNSGTPKVGIGMTDPDVALDVAGDIHYTGVIQDVSDRRLKKDIAIIPAGSLNKIKSLQGVSFKMKNGDNHMETGFIAQDVQPIYPHLVQTDNKGMLSMNYIGLIAPMVEAMKELKAENDALRTRIEAIENKEN